MSSVEANVEALSENSAVNPTSGVVDASAFGDLPFVKDAISATDNAAAGDVEALRGDIESYVGSAVSVALDPIGFLVGTGVEFVLDFVAPVRDAIQLVTGDAEALTAGSQAFDQVKAELDRLGQDLTETLDSELKDWDGQAADSVRAKMATFVEGVQNTAGQANNLSELLQMSATMMEAAEGVIKGILGDFITWAIMTWVPALASAGPTFGASTAAAGAATGVQAGITCAKTAQNIQRITKIINTIMNVITAIKAVLDTIRIVESVEQITSGSGGGTGAAGVGSSAAGTANSDLGSVKEHAGEVAGGYQRGAEQHGVTVDPDNDIARTNADGSSTKINDDGSPTLDSQGNEQSSPTDSFGVGESALNNTGEQLGNAADALEEQAEGGGFSDVPADRTISGQLDV
ncbi:PPE domain-containing protein [Allosaccharopolyspora coralli]|uniref:PPE domain-containing protein n=1 Tax=Allosaccharopolyspora coralli TaxID=2665642 RepID=A0A5Q3QCC3_9PSEU|nr:WXG100 family type VII secretion target [Allosaccharopolyspora coralli]QGK71540.1 PPE domain-containing protein [Allosaccharopolyspora coralli]